MLNGANARLLSRFTGKDAHKEASPSSQTYNLVSAIKKRRLKWLGHILRMEGDRLVKFATKTQFDQGLAGDLFEGLPTDWDYEHISDVTSNRNLWRKIGACLGDTRAIEELVEEEEERQRRDALPRQKKKKKRSKRSKPPESIQPPAQIPPDVLRQLEEQFPPP